MKREEVVGLFVYFVILAVAIVYGLTVIRPFYAISSFHSVLLYALFILRALVTGILTTTICLELGHICGAKIGKYNILSVCLVGLCFHKSENKWKFKFSSFNGLTGETKILPKEEKSNPTPYLIFGTLFLAIVSVLYIILYYVLKDNSGTAKDLSRFFLTAGVVCLTLLLFNIIPFKMDTLNDGYRLVMVSNPKNKEAFNELLRVEHEISVGNNNVEIKTFTDTLRRVIKHQMNNVDKSIPPS